MVQIPHAHTLSPEVFAEVSKLITDNVTLPLLDEE
jgi:hypothetical protein